MKSKLLLLGALAALALPSALRAEDANTPPPQRPDPQQLREQLRDLPPEERQARLREMREKYGLPEGAPAQRPLQGQGAPQRSMMAGAGALSRIMMVLTPEQRESIRDASEANRDKVRGLEEQLREARKAVLEATLEKDFNEDALRKKLEAAAKLDTEITLLRAKTLSEIEPPLSEEQIEKIKNPPALGDGLRQRQGQAPDGAPGERPFRDQTRPRPPGDGPPDANDLPPPVKL